MLHSDIANNGEKCGRSSKADDSKKGEGKKLETHFDDTCRSFVMCFQCVDRCIQGRQVLKMMVLLRLKFEETDVDM